MKKFLFLFLFFLVISCGSKKDEINVRSGVTNMETGGNIEIKQEDIDNFFDSL